jgi:hypothetical protein
LETYQVYGDDLSDAGDKIGEGFGTDFLETKEFEQSMTEGFFEVFLWKFCAQECPNFIEVLFRERNDYEWHKVVLGLQNKLSTFRTVFINSE